MNDISVHGMQEIWTEKYRPKKLADVVGQENIVSRLRLLLDKKSLPHCLFVGPAGIGKTTVALAMANELFGERGARSNFLELNASDERGIDTIRVKVKDFARTMALGGGFKIVYLDEADALTREAQHALRRVMESFSEGCRFILACNYSSRIIAPIQSRCAIFRFSPLSQHQVSGFLKRIAENEGIPVNIDTLNAMYEVSGGDLRKAINIFQTLASEGNISVDAVRNHARKDPELVRQMLSNAMNGDFLKSRENLAELLADLSGEDIIKEIHNQVIEMRMPDEQKIYLLEKIGECEWRLIEGCDTRIQIEALLAWISVNGKNN